MSEVRFVAVLVDSGHPGIMDRETGKVRVFHLADVAIKATADLNAKHRNSDSYDWSDYKVIAELAAPPERILPEFRPVTFTGLRGNDLGVEKSLDSEYEAWVYIGNEGRGLYINQYQARLLASAVLRAVGLDPKTTELPEG